MARKDKYPTPPAETVHPPERAERLVHIANDALNRFSGTVDELEKALGMMIERPVGQTTLNRTKVAVARFIRQANRFHPRYKVHLAL
jgi:hypothetical protein